MRTHTIKSGAATIEVVLLEFVWILAKSLPKCE